MLANVSGLGSADCRTIDPEGEVGLKYDLDEVCHTPGSVLGLTLSQGAPVSMHAVAQDTFRWTCVIGIMALGVTLIIGDLLERRHIYRIPEAAVGLAVGGACAAVATLAGNAEMLHDQTFDDQFFMVWLLPPIIFAAGFNMNIQVCPCSAWAVYGQCACSAHALHMQVACSVWAAAERGNPDPSPNPNPSLHPSFYNPDPSPNC